MAGTEPQDLVADGRDDRDQQQPAANHHQRLLPPDERKRDDREQDHDDQEFGAAALVGGWVLADRADDQWIASLERVDRHVLGAVVLEDACDVRRPTDQGEVAEEDPDADEPLDEVLDQPVLHVRGGDGGDQER